MSMTHPVRARRDRAFATVSTIEHGPLARVAALDVSNRRALGGLLALGTLASLGWVVGLGPLAQTPIPPRSDRVAMVTGQVTQAPGQALYDASCAACHGAHGEGT